MVFNFLMSLVLNLIRNFFMDQIKKLFANRTQIANHSINGLDREPPVHIAEHLGILNFDSVKKGTNIIFDNSKTFAKRSNDHNCGIVFSQQPLELEKKISLKIGDISRSWIGNLRLGLTSLAPEQFAIIPDDIFQVCSTNRRSSICYWARELPEYICQPNTIFYFFVMKNGEVYCGRHDGGSPKFLLRIPDCSSISNLWLMLDIYGAVTSVSLLQYEQRLRDLSNPVFEDCYIDYQTENCIPNESRQIASDTQSHPGTTEPELENHIKEPSRSPYQQEVDNTTNNQFSKFSRCSKLLRPALFHQIVGEGVHVTDTNTVTCITENCAFVISNEYMQSNEFIVVEVLETEIESINQLQFGITNQNPKNIASSLYDEDSEDVLLLETINTTKALRVKKGDFVLISVLEHGAVNLKKNNDNFVVAFVWPLSNPPVHWILKFLAESTKVRVYRTIVTDIQFDDCDICDESELSADAKMYLEFDYSISNEHINLQPMKLKRPSLNWEFDLSPEIVTVSTTLGMDIQPSDRQASASSSKISNKQPCESTSYCRNICVICGTAKVNCILLDCSHGCTCYDCGLKLKLGPGNGRCPVCRNSIKELMRVYLS